MAAKPCVYISLSLCKRTYSESDFVVVTNLHVFGLPPREYENGRTYEGASR